MAKKIIFHVDVNSAFLSWEAVHRLTTLGEQEDIREVPSAIGGDVERRLGVILAKSIPAKQYGVVTGEPVVAAVRKCPELMLCKPNHDLYAAYSKELMRLLGNYTPIVEQYSVDEAFMDMTGTEGLYGEPIALANRIKDHIYKELGFTVNIGVSTNKLLAKMASDFRKPNLVHTLFPEEIAEKMWPLGVGELFFVGKKAADRLHMLGIHTIGQLAQADVGILRAHLHKQGEVIYQYANGIDKSEVLYAPHENKGYGNSTTLPQDIDSLEAAKRVLLSLCEMVSARLRADDKKAVCISVSMVNTYFEASSHQKTLLSSTNSTHIMYQQACKIFETLWNQKTPIRQLGVHAKKLEEGNTYQYNLFDTGKEEKYRKLDAAIDSIRNKHGAEALQRAALITKGTITKS